jgi:hypothetical protein
MTQRKMIAEKAKKRNFMTLFAIRRKEKYPA